MFWACCAEQNPQAGCREELDLDKIKGMGITQQDLDARLAPVTADQSSTPDQEQTNKRGPVFLPNNGEYISTGFDQRSVMRVIWAPDYFKAGEQSKCNGPNVEVAVGGQPQGGEADVSAQARGRERQRRQVPDHPLQRGAGAGALRPRPGGAVREGEARPEEAGAARESQTIEKVVQEERLTPRGVTALPTEEFLCQINPHVCVKAHGKNRWSNTCRRPRITWPTRT